MPAGSRTGGQGWRNTGGSYKIKWNISHHQTYILEYALSIFSTLIDIYNL